MMKHNLITSEHGNGDHQEDDHWIKRATRSTNQKISNNEPTKKDESSPKKSASILGASGYLFQGQMGDGSTTLSGSENPHNPDNNQNFQTLDDRTNLASRAEGSRTTQANEANNSQTVNTNTATNATSKPVNVHLANQEAITNLAAPLMDHIASLPKSVAASLPQKTSQPLIQITTPKSPTTLPGTTTPNATQITQNPLLQVKHPMLDAEAAFIKKELLAERERKKEDRERFNQNRLAIQEFDSKEAAGETAEMYHELAEGIIDDAAYYASLESPDDWELDEEEVASIKQKGVCNASKNIEDTTIFTSNNPALFAKNNQSEHNNPSGMLTIAAENNETSPKKQTDVTLASTDSTRPNYLDIPARDVIDQSEKPTQTRV